MEHFEEWFAVRIEHKDDELWPARLSYDPEKGIYLNTINFASPADLYGNSSFRAETITGFIDYQTPATLIRPFIQECSPGKIGVNAQLIRARFRVVAEGVLKNLHLESLTERCFTGIYVEMPSFHAWVAPKLLHKTPEKGEGAVTLNVNVAGPVSREFALSGGARAEILVGVSTPFNGDVLTLTQYTALEISLPHAVDYLTIMAIESALEFTFSFLIGTRLKTPVFYFHTTQTRCWNNIDETVTVESWIVPAWKSASEVPDRYTRMFTEKTTPVGPKPLLEFCLSRENDPIIYLMNMVLAAEMRDMRVPDSFLELLGCLEDFDLTHFEKGARKKVILKYRIERLTEMWSSDGFRGRPDIQRVVDLRNLKPHGRGREISAQVAQEMGVLVRFFCALARFHILKFLGFDRGSIAMGFINTAHRYGMFVPLDLVPPALQQSSHEAP